MKMVQFLFFFLSPTFSRLTDFASSFSQQKLSFLDSIDRIAEENYIPTDDDILQARVRTLAVSEHLFNIDGVNYR